MCVCVSLIGIRTLCDSVARGYGDHSPLTWLGQDTWTRESRHVVSISWSDTALKPPEHIFLLNHLNTMERMLMRTTRKSKLFIISLQKGRKQSSLLANRWKMSSRVKRAASVIGYNQLRSHQSDADDRYCAEYSNTNDRQCDEYSDANN